jgi:hypothetical protein
MAGNFIPKKPKIELMKALVITLALLCCAGNSNSGPYPAESSCWGFFGHRKINYQAVFSLPPPLIFFFKKHLQYLSSHAVDADMRRYATAHEAPRHYIDLDRYGTPPFPELPRNWTDALLQYSSFRTVLVQGDTLNLLLGPVCPDDSLVYFNPALLHPTDSSGSVTRQEFRQFFQQQLLPQFYEEKWSVLPAALEAAFCLQLLPCQEIFASDHLSQHGILPYHLEQLLQRLSRAFAEKDLARILRHAADMGHYIGDAHVPLHTTENYNGQLTGQDGIHAFWESRLPELFAEEEYSFWVGKASLIEQPQSYFWQMVFDSHELVDSVLRIEKSLRASFPLDHQLCYEQRGASLVKTQCREFAAAYHRHLGDMVEKRMQDAVRAVANAWFTAWIMAGQPDLLGVEPALSPAPDSASAGTEAAAQQKVMLGREHEN